MRSYGKEKQMYSTMPVRNYLNKKLVDKKITPSKEIKSTYNAIFGQRFIFE